MVLARVVTFQVGPLLYGGPRSLCPVADQVEVVGHQVDDEGAHVGLMLEGSRAGEVFVADSVVEGSELARLISNAVQRAQQLLAGAQRRGEDPD